MNTEIYDKQKLVEYLLGNLPDADAEQFDESSFVDESFAETLAAAENDLVDAYVRGELSGANLERFENYYLASPRRREKVKFAAAFQDYAKRETKPETSNGFFTVFFNFLNANRLSFGFASLVLMLILSGLWFFAFRRAQPETEVVISKTPAPENRQITPAPNTKNDSAVNTETSTEIPSAANAEKTKTPEKANKNVNVETNRNRKTEKTPTVTPPKITLASFVLAPPVRGNQITNFPISKKTTDVAVRFELESNDFSAYRVALTDESGANLRQFGNLRVRGNSLNVRFPAKSLKSGIYSFVVSGVKDGATEIISNYTFRVVIK